MSKWFSTEVEIDPSDLEEAGWVYQGDKGKDKTKEPAQEDIADTVRRWHDQTHRGAWRFCDERPCLDIRDLYLKLGTGLPESMVMLP